MLTPTQVEAHRQRQRFHSAIDARAAELADFRLASRRPYINRPNSVRIDISQEPEGDTAIPVIPCECVSVFVSAAGVIPLRGARSLKGDVTIDAIQRVISREFRVGRSDLLSGRRLHSVARPRQIAMYLAREMTLQSFPEIARRFCKSDHTSPLRASRKIAALVKSDRTLAARIKSLKVKISAEAA